MMWLEKNVMLATVLPPRNEMEKLRMLCRSSRLPDSSHNHTTQRLLGKVVLPMLKNLPASQASTHLSRISIYGLRGQNAFNQMENLYISEYSCEPSPKVQGQVGGHPAKKEPIQKHTKGKSMTTNTSPSYSD